MADFRRAVCVPALCPGIMETAQRGAGEAAERKTEMETKLEITGMRAQELCGRLAEIKKETDRFREDFKEETGIQLKELFNSVYIADSDQSREKMEEFTKKAGLNIESVVVDDNEPGCSFKANRATYSKESNSTFFWTYEEGEAGFDA